MKPSLKMMNDILSALFSQAKQRRGNEEESSRRTSHVLTVNQTSIFSWRGGSLSSNVNKAWAGKPRDQVNSDARLHCREVSTEES